MNRAVIDCEKLRNNVSVIKNSIPDKCKIIAVVKGDAYGHGLEGIAKELDKNDDVLMLAVSSLDEAMDCIRSGVRKNILLLNSMPAFFWEEAINNCDIEERQKLITQLIFSVYSIEDLHGYKTLSEKYSVKFNVHVRLDFGGGCRGFTKSQFTEKIPELFTDNDYYIIRGVYAQVYSFYCCSDEQSEKDMTEYIYAIEKIPDLYRKQILVHFSTSLSCFRFPHYCFDAVRIGAALYGMPVASDSSFDTGLKEIMSIEGTVLNVVDIDGEIKLDYIGGLNVNKRRIAVLSLGSWDIPCFFKGPATTVLIRNKLFNTVGSPSMDSCCVDVSECSDVRPGDKVVVLGSYEGVTLKDKIVQNGFDISNCQMMFSGINRIKKYLE